MTKAVSTGLTALPENLRAVSAASGIIHASDASGEAFSVQGSGVSVIENFRSGEDKIVLPVGTDLSGVEATPGWHGDAWGLHITYGEGSSVFLRWGWKFEASGDLAVADEGSELPDPSRGSDSTEDDGGNTETGTDTGTGPDTLELKVSSDSYKGDAKFTVHVNGEQIGGILTASAKHGEGTNTYTLNGDFGEDASVSVAFINDLWDGTADADRNLHIEGASLNGKAIEGAAQTVWGDYSVTLTADPETDQPGAGANEGGRETPGKGGSNPDGEVNVLIRGQSNAQAFKMYGGADELERVLEDKLGTNVNILASYEATDGHNTINSATRFMDWAKDGQQQGLIDFIGDQSDAVRDNPTLTVWMHNEYDQQSMDLSTDAWLAEVRADAELVRDALGQDASTTPYEFVPIRYPYGGNFEAIGNGMEALSAEGGFNADISWAAQGASMDGDGFANSSHLGWNDAQALGRELGEELASVLSSLTGPRDGGVPPVDPVAPVDPISPIDPPVGEPDGYRLVLEDNFSNGYDYAKWGTPFDGGVYWNGAFTWDDADVGVRNGEMQVTMTNHGGWWTAGGFNSFKAGNTITYGKIEFDAKVPNEQGTMTAILTWPATDVWPADGEIDILETPGNDNMFSTHYEGPNGEHWYDSVRSSSYDASQWHHYEMTWLPNRLTVEVDGQLMAEWTDPAQIPDVPHGFGAMGFVGAGFDQWMGGAPDGSTPDVVTVSIDNVRMYQADGIL
jgi:hypothetical protein